MYSIEARLIALAVFNQQEGSQPAPLPPTPGDIAPNVDVSHQAPLNRRVKPRMRISEEALRAVRDSKPSDPSMGAALAQAFPRTGDRAAEIALKQMFNNYTSTGSNPDE
jgi:hypothetical protein